MLMSTSLLAQKISVGVGLDDILDSNRRDLDGGVLAPSAIAVAGRVKFDSKKDFFVGAGFTARFPISKFAPFF